MVGGAMRRCVYIFCIIFWAVPVFSGAGLLFAQSFSASVNTKSITTDDAFEISFVYSGKDINGVGGFTAPTFTDFKVVSGPNQSTSMQIINGAVSGQKSYSYYLQPIKPGKFTIGTASITVGGQKLTSEPITIEVTKGGGKPKKDESSDIDMKEIAENLFIKATADKFTVYNGEQVTVTYKLYTRLNISTPQINKLPEYQGFWTEEIDMPNVINFSRETIDGIAYNVAVLKKAALFPQRAGELTVTAYELKIPVIIQRKKKSNDPWGDFFNDPFFRTTETVEYTAKSNAVKVKVLELPSNDKGEYFTGAVGDFQLVGSIDKKNVKQGDPVRVQYTIRGVGNISLVTLPEFELASGIEKYEDKSENEIVRTGIISGAKKIDYLLIPRNAGQVEVPPMKFTFFNPGSKKYITRETEGYTISVSPSADFVSSLPDAGGKGENDIRYIKLQPGVSVDNDSGVLNDPVVWLFGGLPFLALAGVGLFVRRRENIMADLGSYREQKAKKFAAKKLKKATQLMEAGDKDGFYLEISRTIQQYLEHKLRIPTADFTLEKAEEQLQQSGLSETLLTELRATFEGIQYIRFAQKDGAETAMQSILSSASGLITGLEKAITKGRSGK